VHKFVQDPLPSNTLLSNRCTNI